MINDPIIVGCGTIGSTLSLKFAESRLVSNLKIYDFDTVSKSDDKSSYPFKSSESGIPKVQIIRFLCKKINPNLNVEVSQEKVVKSFNNNRFVVDCRDCKVPTINSSVRLALDGYLLYVNSLTKITNSKNYYKYIFPKNPEFINSAVNIILNYFINDEYIFHDFRLYNLRSCKKYIIEEEK